MKIKRLASAAILTAALLSSGPIAADPPADSGTVTRGQEALAFTWVDFDSGLRIIIGADIDEFCGGVNNFDLVDFMRVEPQPERVIERLSGDVQTTVWDFLDFDCALFTTLEPVASGQARLRATDNDLFGIGDDDRHTNSWGLMAHGKLEDSFGTDMNLNAFLRQVFGNPSGYHRTAKVVLN